MALSRLLLVAGALTWQAVAAAPQATASPYDTTTTITAIASPSTSLSSNNISIISLPSNYTTSNYIAFSPILQSTQTALDVPVGGGGGSTTSTPIAITYAIVTTYTPVPSPVTGLTQVSLALPAVTPAASPVTGITQVSLALPAETLTVTMPTQRTTEAFTLVPVVVTGGAQSAQSGGGSPQTTILAQPELLSQTQGGSTVSHPAGPSPTVLYVATASGASAGAAAGGNANTHVPGVPLTAGGAPVVVGGTTYSLASSGGALYANGVSTAMPGGVQATATSEHAGVAAAVMSVFSTATGGSTGAAASGRTGSAGAGSMATGVSSTSGGSGSAASTLTSAVSGPSSTSGASGAAVQTASGGAVPALPGLWLSVLGLSFALAGGLLAV